MNETFLNDVQQINNLGNNPDFKNNYDSYRNLNPQFVESGVSHACVLPGKRKCCAYKITSPNENRPGYGFSNIRCSFQTLVESIEFETEGFLINRFVTDKTFLQIARKNLGITDDALIPICSENQFIPFIGSSTKITIKFNDSEMFDTLDQENIFKILALTYDVYKVEDSSNLEFLLPHFTMLDYDNPNNLVKIRISFRGLLQSIIVYTPDRKIDKTSLHFMVDDNSKTIELPITNLSGNDILEIDLSPDLVAKSQVDRMERSYCTVENLNRYAISRNNFKDVQLNIVINPAMDEKPFHLWTICQQVIKISNGKFEF